MPEKKKVSWIRKIYLLKKLIKEIGRLWTSGTTLAGYDEEGPYHCEDCIFLKGVEIK